MKYNDLYTTDKTIIDYIIQEANLILDSSIIVSVNKLVQECSFDNQELTIFEEKHNINDNDCCFPFLFSFFYTEPAEPVLVGRKIELIMFLQNLSKDEICTLARYQNLYYKNRLFTRVMDKEQWIYDENKQITTWIYDNICVYLYKRYYMV